MQLRALVLLAIVCAVSLFTAALVWIHEHPSPAYFDEALYSGSAIFDDWEAKHHGVRGVAHALVHVDPRRPPMYRVLALPVTIATGADLEALRVFSLIVFFVAAALMADAARSAAGAAAGVTAFLLELAAPVHVFATRLFATEYPFLLALALLLWSLFRRKSVGVAIAIGIGLLAKVSFLFAAVPMLVVAFAFHKRWPFLPSRRALLASSAAGVAIASTWWIANPVEPLLYAFAPSQFIRHRLGPLGSPTTMLQYVYEMMRTATGFALAALIGAALVLVARRRLQDPRHEAFVAIAAAGAVLAPFLTYASGSHNPRFLAPSTFLIVAAVAVVFSATMPRAIAVAALAAAVQVALMAMPRAWPAGAPERSLIRRGVTEVMAPAEQMDWTRLRAFADRLGMPRPRIAILGESYQFSPPQIRYAWQRARRDVSVLPLYRWDVDHSFQLGPVVEKAAGAQLVVTVPGLRGEPTDGQLPNNVYNNTLVRTLAADPRFAGPFAVDVGVREPVRAAVFVRRW